MKKPTEWPKNCPWPEPDRIAPLGSLWEPEDAESMPLDEEGESLLAIKEYMDGLVENGRLNEDYSIAPHSPALFDTDEPDDEHWTPSKGEEYWHDNRFQIEDWEMDLLDHLNRIKINPCDTINELHRILGYEFINENLLRQAFTRRAFAIEYCMESDNENLEFIGDSVLGMVLTRGITERFLEYDCSSTLAPLQPKNRQINEGTLSKARQFYTNKEYLANRAKKMGLDKYILYGTGEEETDSSLEDVVEAIIGAVAVDSGWNWDVLDDLVDRLLYVQLDYPDRFLKKSFYDIFNSWHQKHFGVMPEYTVSEGRRISPDTRTFYCTLRYFLPENDKGIYRDQRVDVDAPGRSQARELAAEMAYYFVQEKGLWLRLEDAGVDPKLDDSINQLQELFQKKYVEKPEYDFRELQGDQWECVCVCSGVFGEGLAGSKTLAKKKAAYEVLQRLLEGAGCQS